MKSELEVSAVDARYYFATRDLGLKWYNYDELKEISDLICTTTAVGHLPFHLVVLLAADAAETRLQRKNESSSSCLKSWGFLALI